VLGRCNLYYTGGEEYDHVNEEKRCCKGTPAKEKRGEKQGSSKGGVRSG